MIYSMTSSSPEDAPRGMEFLYNRFRFNVATSRARALCILVGSPALFSPECRRPRQMRMANGVLPVPRAGHGRDLIRRCARTVGYTVE